MLDTLSNGRGWGLMPISFPLHIQWPHSRSLKSALVEVFTTCKSTNVIKLGFPPTLLLADSQLLNSYWHTTEKTCLKFVLKNRYWIKVKETTWANALKHKCRGCLFSKEPLSAVSISQRIWERAWKKKWSALRYPDSEPFLRLVVRVKPRV